MSDERMSKFPALGCSVVYCRPKWISLVFVSPFGYHLLLSQLCPFSIGPCLFIFHCFIHFRVEWFLKKKLGTCHVVVDCSGTSNPKFYFDLLLFHLAHGKTRPQKTPKMPKKRPKISKKKILFDTFKVFT